MNTLTRHGIRNGVLTALYVLAVALFMQNVERVLGSEPDSFVGPMAFILLFMVSALITGSLVLWGPLKLLLDGRKKEAGTQLGVTGATLFVILAALFIALAAR